MQATHYVRKKIHLGFISVFAAALLLVSTSCMAAEYVALKIYPENVGVFTVDGRQQFVAFGIDAAGRVTNITTDVDWISSNTDKVTIDKNGLATIVSSVTSGKVTVTASYPKKGKIAPLNHLLLSN